LNYLDNLSNNSTE